MVEEALEFARSSPEPDPATVRRHVYADPINPPEALRPRRRPARPRRRAGSTRCATGIAEEMRANPAILYFGEGTGERGGSFAHTKGLWQEFGAERMVDTPISEQGFTAAAVGASATGARTVVGPDVRRLRLRDGRADLPAGGEAALHEQRPDERRRWWCGSAPGRCAAPGRTTAASTIRSSRTCRGSSSACPRRRPTPRG